MAGWNRWLKPTLTSLPAHADSLDQAVDLPRTDARGLLNQHVRAGMKCPLGQRRELVMARRHDDDVGPRREQLVYSAESAAAVLCNQRIGAVADRVERADQLIGIT